MRWQLRNSNTRYGQVGRVMHWASVALIAVIVVISAQFEGLADGPERTGVIGRHASFGLVFLALILLRAGWRLTNVNPVYSYTIGAWQKQLAISIHLFIYSIVILQCVVGIAQLVTHGSALTLFNTFVIEPPYARDAELRELLHDLHASIAKAIYATISVHVCAAVYHQIFGVVEIDTS